jgi:hypothetical protein
MTKLGDVYEIDQTGDWEQYANRELFPPYARPAGVVTINGTRRGALVRNGQKFWIVTHSKCERLSTINIRIASQDGLGRKVTLPPTRPACINLDKKTRQALERIDYTLAASVRTAVEFYLEHHPKLMQEEIKYKPAHAKRKTLRSERESQKARMNEPNPVIIHHPS